MPVWLPTIESVMAIVEHVFYINLINYYKIRKVYGKRQVKLIKIGIWRVYGYEGTTRTDPD
ncbi:hypothetical protein [Neptunomonas sp.]|uniref:hypothetical protein n=1 Tax=Neptunomonas sp. TaxID=1971898 RepID=UPI003569B645